MEENQINGNIQELIEEQVNIKMQEYTKKYEKQFQFLEELMSIPNICEKLSKFTSDSSFNYSFLDRLEEKKQGSPMVKKNLQLDLSKTSKNQNSTPTLEKPAPVPVSAPGKSGVKTGGRNIRNNITAPPIKRPQTVKNENSNTKKNFFTNNKETDKKGDKKPLAPKPIAKTPREAATSARSSQPPKTGSKTDRSGRTTASLQPAPKKPIKNTSITPSHPTSLNQSIIYIIIYRQNFKHKITKRPEEALKRFKGVSGYKGRQKRRN